MMQTFARQLALGTLIVGAILWGNPASVPGADPLIGTWKLDTAKSKFNPGPPSKSITVRFEQRERGSRSRPTWSALATRPSHTEYTGNYDGKDYSDHWIRDWSRHRVAEAHRRSHDGAHRQEERQGRDDLHAEGLARRQEATVTIKGTNRKGSGFNNVVVFVKQPVGILRGATGRRRIPAPFPGRALTDPTASMTPSLGGASAPAFPEWAPSP